jgi:hypothetical protein
MLAEIPYMIVWGFFSAMGWMTANWVVEKHVAEKQKDPTPVVQQEQKKEEKDEPKKDSN